jgi:hypothetical protein
MNFKHLAFASLALAGAAACSSDDSSVNDASTDQSIDSPAKDSSLVDSSIKDVSTSDVDSSVGTDASDASTTDANDAALTEASVDASVEASVDASDGGIFVDSGSVSACNQCAQSNCTTSIAVCEQDSTCLSWLTCVNQCTDVSCESACDAQYPTAKSLFDPVYTCACTNCVSQCAGNLEPCTHGQDGGA